MSLMNFSKCPKGSLGDIQVEAVLTPLLFETTSRTGLFTGRPSEVRRGVGILDVGCGSARILAGLLGFPNVIRQHISYVGIEPTPHLLDRAHRAISKLEKDVLGGQKINTQFKQVQLKTNDQIDPEKLRFRYVSVVNVLHHIPVPSVPEFLRQVLSMVESDGFLIIHDFDIGDCPRHLETDRYCDRCVFLGPTEIGAMFGMASTQVGGFRRARRTSKRGRPYFLYTYVLQKSNELDPQRSDVTVWGDDILWSDDVDVGLLYSLEKTEAFLQKHLSTAWYREYLQLLRHSRDALLAKRPGILKWFKVYEANGWIRVIRRGYAYGTIEAKTVDN